MLSEGDESSRRNALVLLPPAADLPCTTFTLDEGRAVEDPASTVLDRTYLGRGSVDRRRVGPHREGA